MTYSLFGDSVGLCVPQSRDTDSIRGFCNSTVYVSTSLPPVCLISQVTTTTTGNTYAARIIERISSVSVNNLQAGITNAITYTDNSVAAFIAKYYPQINAITFPTISAVNGSVNGSVTGFVKLGIVISLSSSPSDNDKLTLCLVVHLLLKYSNVVGNTDVLSQCVTVLVGTASSSTSSSKRNVQGSSSVSVLVQASVSSNSSGSTPTSGPTVSPTSGPSVPTSGPTVPPTSGPTVPPTSGPTVSPNSGPSAPTPTSTKSPSGSHSYSAAIVGIVGLVMISLLF